MSERINGMPVIKVEPDSECELCGKIAECRPYGPNGESICFDCAMKYERTTVIQVGIRLYGMLPEEAEKQADKFLARRRGRYDPTRIRPRNRPQ